MRNRPEVHHSEERVEVRRLVGPLDPADAEGSRRRMKSLDKVVR